MAVVLFSAAAIWLLSADARREVDALATANADSTQWSLAQSEVEFLAFTIAARAVVAGKAQPADARRRFDVFYSRMQTLKSARSFADVRAHSEVEISLADIDDFFADAIPFVDADDGAFVAALPGLVDRFPSLQADLRTISLAGVSVLSARSETRRAAVSGALTDLGFISFGLLALLLALVGILFMINRASQRQTSEIALTQGRLQAIISTSLDAILVAGKDGHVLDFNGAAEGIFGYTREEAIGADVADLIIPDHLLDAHNDGMARYRQTGIKHVVGSGLLKLEAKRKDGSVFPVELSINSAESEEGEIFVSYIRDISKRVESENELVEARDKALAGEKAKADLLAVMSHEMRTPLNGVLGTLDLLSDTVLDERQQKYVGVMDASGKMLLEHVNNVLDISRVDAGKAVRVEEPFNVCELAQSTVEGLQTTAALRGNTLKIAQLGPRAAMRVGDRKRIQQILFNLLGNAIKFTENGTITLEIDCQNGGETMEFRVIDTGIGISEADLARIFEDFVTLDASYQREVEGTGLGLGIVRRLAELLEGEIGVESEEGDGSVFWVRLPLPHVADRPVTRPVSMTPHEVSGDALRVLLVEDNEVNRMVAREMLEKNGCEVTEAIDGQDGVRAAEAEAFDLILMDISMPKLDGTTAAKMVKNSNGPNVETPIIALTAHALPADVARFRDAGMEDVITKPLSFDRLKAVLTEFSAPDVREERRQDGTPMADLIETLGAEKAEALRQRVVTEVKVGIVDLTAMAGDESRRTELGALAHKLAGSVAMFGEQPIWEQLKALEERSSDMSSDEIHNRLAELERLLHR
ncbi:response regulator [Aliiroseovarius sp. Z3]|uniref:hybrid sensor histidine kinase/response regulator n=1 Tax=Aliiroseovarius sp. Z3 TaxID=2811402 RepID=UPI0023B29B91|nr:PAS domain-containing hybrid sensor histidine kinase/response regulator [Aliiroseovarius sp. Z3]MDE9450230.1 response regulator [Aliiroseovarius sp. Z3]